MILHRHPNQQNISNLSNVKKIVSNILGKKSVTPSS